MTPAELDLDDAPALKPGEWLCEEGHVNDHPWSVCHVADCPSVEEHPAPSWWMR